MGKLTDDQRSAINARAYARGMSFQREIAELAEYVDGLLLVEQYPRTHFPSKGQRRGVPPGYARVIGKGWCDFIALYYGRGFTFDAKSTTQKSKFRSDKQHQFDKLLKAARRGTQAFYMIRWEFYGTVALHQVHGNMSFPHQFEYGDWAYYTSDTRYGNWLETLVQAVAADW